LQIPDPAHRSGNEFLPAPTRVHGHDEDEIHEGERFVEDSQRRARLIARPGEAPAPRTCSAKR
jgi:hypothetical protein